jgi:hypothetical protein
VQGRRLQDLLTGLGLLLVDLCDTPLLPDGWSARSGFPARLEHQSGLSSTLGTSEAPGEDASKGRFLSTNQGAGPSQGRAFYPRITEGDVQ